MIKGLLDRIAKLESRVTLIETQNAAQKDEISKLNSNNVSTEWITVIGKKKMISENQMNLFSEQKEKKRRKIMLYFLEYRHQQQQRSRNQVTYEILEAIGISKAEQESAKIS